MTSTARNPALGWLRTPAGAAALLALASGLLGILAWTMPDAFYYPVVWRYYYGPVVADATGMPATVGGVTAYAGYNAVNTVTWAIVLGVALWNIHDGFRRHRIALTRPLVYSLLPTIAAGGTLRGLIDADWVPEPWAYLFITPNIYLVMFAYTLTAFLLGVALERRPRFSARYPRFRHWHAVLFAGTLALVVTLGGVAAYVVEPPSGFVRWVVLPQVFAGAAVITALIIALSRLAGLQYARDSLYVLVLYGQIVDGTQNYLGLTLGYTSKLMGTNFLAHWLGDAGLLVGKVALVVPALAYVKARVEPDPQASPDLTLLVLVAFLALGLAMGFHGGVGMLLGV